MALPSGWIATGRQLESGQAYLHEVQRPGGSDFYALKALKNVNRRERFAREIENMRRLRNLGVHVVPEVVEADLDAERPYFVMPWYRDGSLQDRIDNAAYVNDPRQGLTVLVQLAISLEAIHKQDFAHRDVKPSNVLFDGTELAVADFGLSLQLDEDAERLTDVDEAVGSRLYIAPENEGGLNPDTDQRAADCYAFAKVLWAVLAGRTPPARENQLLEPLTLQTVLGERFARLTAIQSQLLQRDPGRDFAIGASFVRSSK
jgi:serine/threonine protein kinase